MKKTAYLPVKMTPDLKRRLVEMAEKKDRSAGWLARCYIEEGLKRESSVRRKDG